MKTKILSYFRDRRQFRLFLAMCFSTLFGFILIAVRLQFTDIDVSEILYSKDFSNLRGSRSFFFLIWNLFLAWIPYWIALNIERIAQISKSRLIVGGCLISWLLFFPNAPYIVTDLLHLKSRSPIPKWYDLIVFVSFAWTGLMLGFLSLHEIQLFFRRRLSAKVTWLLTFSSIVLCAFGIYLGRFLRWNSWDVLTNPGLLFQDIITSISDPSVYSNTLKITFIFSIFLLLAYLTLVALIGDADRSEKNKTTLL